MKDYYEILQVREDASPEVIEAAYRRLARMRHPDVNSSRNAEQQMKEINEAYEVLGDPISRASYDHELRRSKGSVPFSSVSTQPRAIDNLKWRWLYVPLLLLVLLVYGLVITSRTRHSDATDPATAFTEWNVAADATSQTCKDKMEEVASRVSPSVVRILAGRASGSGVLVSSSGLVLTALHVVRGASSISVELGSNRRYVATWQDWDETADLALLRISPDAYNPPALWSTSEPRPGMRVLAFGYPLGISGQPSLTSGLVSRRFTDDGVEYIQTDAALNPGNSGGPLVDECGRLIGISVAKARQAEGIGLAVSITYAKPFAYQLVKGAKTASSRSADLTPQPTIAVSPTYVASATPRPRLVAPAATPTTVPTAMTTTIPSATAIPMPIAALGASIGDGSHLVGREVLPGVYRTDGNIAEIRTCEWARLRGLSGSSSDRIGTGSGFRDPQIVTISSTDVAFVSSGCGMWHIVP